MNIYFISETYIKKNSTVSLNVEPALINTAIIDAQVLHIQSVLGTKLYKKIENLIETNTLSNPGNENYKLLLDDYIMATTLQWTIYECLPYIRFKIMNKSVNSQNSDNSTPIELEEMKFFMSNLRNKAEFYSQRMSDYICANITLFPEYKATQIDEMEPSSISYFSGIQLDEPTYATERFLGLDTHIIKSNI